MVLKRFSMKHKSYRLHVCDREPVGPEVAQDLVVEEFLFHRVVEVNVVVQEEVLLEEEHVVPGLLGERTVGRSQNFRHSV